MNDEIVDDDQVPIMKRVSSYLIMLMHGRVLKIDSRSNYKRILF